MSAADGRLRIGFIPLFHDIEPRGLVNRVIATGGVNDRQVE